MEQGIALAEHERDGSEAMGLHEAPSLVEVVAHARQRGARNERDDQVVDPCVGQAGRELGLQVVRCIAEEFERLGQ